jgi:two-component system NtrC family sensor kinase
MNNKYKILLVDDEPLVLSALQRQLRKADFQVFTAESAKEALNKLQQDGSFNLVISDYRMPEMNGVDFLYAVRQRWPETVRMVLSGYADTDTVIAATNRGKICKFISKPWSEDFLLSSIEEGLANSEKENRLKARMEQMEEKFQKIESLIVTSFDSICGDDSQVLTVYQNLIDQMPVGIVWIDCHGAVICKNSLAETLLELGVFAPGEDFCNVLPAICNNGQVDGQLLQSINNMDLIINDKPARLMVKSFHKIEILP